MNLKNNCVSAMKSRRFASTHHDEVSSERENPALISISICIVQNVLGQRLGLGETRVWAHSYRLRSCPIR